MMKSIKQTGNKEIVEELVRLGAKHVCPSEREINLEGLNDRIGKTEVR